MSGEVTIVFDPNLQQAISWISDAMVVLRCRDRRNLEA